MAVPLGCLRRRGRAMTLQLLKASLYEELTSQLIKKSSFLLHHHHHHHHWWCRSNRLRLTTKNKQAWINNHQPRGGGPSGKGVGAFHGGVVAGDIGDDKDCISGAG
ncbi:hypothetical protein ACH5RR_004181 [Cinchona calisaya]|uniref:Uncharacterized protein n=1 Tax=Cinchona calisaya TaxID=153742 RepID=A0ABD3AWT6_9GENT